MVVAIIILGCTYIGCALEVSLWSVTTYIIALDCDLCVSVNIEVALYVGLM